MNIIGNFAQTFYIDKDTVKGSPKAFVSGIDLYFSSKPSRVSNFSGLEEPGVDVFICRTQVRNNEIVPVLVDDVDYGYARLPWTAINADANGATATRVNFKVPVPIDTNTPYCFVVKYDGNDTGFLVHRYRLGENELGSSTTGTPNSLDGFYYNLTNTNTALTPATDIDLKFSLFVQKFNTSNTVFSVVNRDFEILNFDPLNFTGSLRHDEIVFANTGPVAAQTVSVSTSSQNVIGTGTTFTTTFANGGYFVISSGNNHYAAIINTVSNNTLLTLQTNCTFTNALSTYTIAPLAVVRHVDYIERNLILIDSTANSTLNFYPNTTCNTIVGITSGATVKISNVKNYQINKVLPKIAINSFQGTTSKLAFYTANSAKVTQATAQNFTNYLDNKVSLGTFIYSASDEQANGASLTNKKSYNIDITLGSNNEYLTPYIDEDGLSVFCFADYINNDATNEHTNSGNATSRHISNSLTLADGQDAEDIRVYVDAFRPVGTNIKVYAKIHNPSDKESFDSKNWSELEMVRGDGIFSNPDNTDELVGFEFGFPSYPIIDYNTRSAGPALSGTVTGADGNNVFVSTISTVNTSIVTGDLVRVYNPLVPNNSLVSVVTASNTTTFTIDKRLSISNTVLSAFIGSGLSVEKVTLKNSAFNNYTGNNVVRYYNSSMGAFDTYKTMAIKIVLLSDDVAKFPLVDKLIAIAVST